MVRATPHLIGKDSGRSDKRVLALDVRPRKAGFALFEGAQLLDWGVTTYGMKGSRAAMTARRRITDLLDRHYPGLVVLRNRRTYPAGSRQTLIAIIRMVRIETARRSIGFRVLSSETLRRFYIGQGCINKQLIASALAAWYRSYGGSCRQSAGRGNPKITE